MTDANRVEQLEGLRNITTNQDFYEKLASGHSASASSSAPNSTNGILNVQYIPVPITIKAQLGSPTALAIGAFATTLTTLSFALMGWRDLSVTTAFIGNFFGVAGIGMVISAQWEIVLGNTYAYTVLSAFGLFYLGFGIIVTPFFGVAEAYGGADTVGYNNALGFFVLSMSLCQTHCYRHRANYYDSVVCVQFLLPYWISTVERGVFWDLLHSPARLHFGLGRLLPQGGWIARHSCCCQQSGWSVCLRFWFARVLHCGQPHVPGSARV
jgi:succinate-acetate transporter protein